MSQISHELRLRQQITLTPRLQQSVKLLQMSTLDFSREVAQAISENPFLEDPDEAAASEPASDAAPEERMTLSQESAPAASDTSTASESPADSPDAPEQYDMPSAYSGDYPTARNYDQPEMDVGQWASSETGMQQALKRNLCGHALSDRDAMLIEYVIDALDDDGYLRIAFDDLAPDQEFSPAPDPVEWETALRLVQQLGRPGIGARDLQECLVLQLDALDGDTPGRDAALLIVQRGLERLARCDYAALCEIASAAEDVVRDACDLIRGLDPRPGAGYVKMDPSHFVVPDVMVRKIAGQWTALSNRDAVPRARLNTLYAELFRRSRYADRSLMSQALQEARWLMRSLEQRNSTILRVAQAIVARQQTYFEYGDVALRPLMLSEIADELEMHESTISRATSNKYMATPAGIVEFKHFFSRELATRTGGTLSAVAVRALIQELIAAENPAQPLSDVALAQKLKEDDIIVARRTVSKYRSQLKIPAAELRRRA